VITSPGLLGVANTPFERAPHLLQPFLHRIGPRLRRVRPGSGRSARASACPHGHVTSHVDTWRRQQFARRGSFQDLDHCLDILRSPDREVEQSPRRIEGERHPLVVRQIGADREHPAVQRDGLLAA
jgi:hypothetical protein